MGGSCSLDNPCDEGVCNLSGPGEPECIPADGDIDGDGIPNNRDFCNQQPGGEFDEDGDGIGDECDACPIAPPPARPDTDNDMVDAPCDPEPSLDGDQITVFEGFNGPLPAAFRADGQWSVVGGQAVFTSNDSSASSTLTTVLPLASRHVAVFTSYRIDRLDPSALQNFVGVTTIDRRPAGLSIVSCGGSRIGGNDKLVLQTDVAGDEKPFLVNLFDTAGLYRVVQRIQNATSACALLANDANGAVTAATGGEIPTEAGLVARGVDTKLQYLLVVQRPN